MKMRAVLGVALICIAGSSMAINKCTGKDGKVTYQESQCESAASTQQIKVPLSAEQAAQRWQFSREKDAMTGREVCLAYSPEVPVGSKRGYAYARLQLAVTPGSMSLTVRTADDQHGLVHNNISGLGIKVGEGEFTPLTRKISQHVLGFDDSVVPSLLGSLKGAKSFQVRLRFWPYDKLADSQPGSLEGAEGAVLAALKCG